MISGTIMTISKDRVKPSPHPDSWKLNEIFATGIVYGTYMAVMTIIFFWAMKSTDFFSVSMSCQENKASQLFYWVHYINNIVLVWTACRALST